MNAITTLAARTRDTAKAQDKAAGTAEARGGLARIVALGLLTALIVPVLATVLMTVPMTGFASQAHAADEDERDNYSLYQLASNASTYFGERNSPEVDSGDRMPADWDKVTRNPATAGDMLGYADPEFSLGNVIGWLFAEATGSTQTIGYSTLTTHGDDGGGRADGDMYAGMRDYAHFGAANADLGLDTMSSGIGGQILALLGGGIMWLLYALALAVGALFYLIIGLLKVLNPFMWFHQAIAGVADASGSTDGAHQQELADGMTRGATGGGALSGLQNWISDWYGLLQSIAWEALVPLFIGFLLIGLVLFKKMDRGSAIKKLIVRVVFIGVGLPLIGSMYTSVLDKFDDSLVGQHSGPTRVVLSTYVDFEAWMMNDRLGIPDQALISWENGQAGNDAMMSVRTTALAINKQSHGPTFRDLNIGTRARDAETAWSNSMVGMEGGASEDFTALASTFAILNSYISGNITTASDFESGIKSAITNVDVDSDTKKEWFIEERGYGDLDKFGEETDYGPTNHPVLSVGGMEGLTSSSPGANTTTFTTAGTQRGCGFRVWADQAPVSCNLSALAAYNYLNTGFGPESMTMYSSNNVTSGLTREDHMAVSQVGTGPAKFAYWHNAATVLGSIVLVGFWYAIGMLVGAIKRTFSLVAAIPFATLGAIAAISKVIVYSLALILEVITTLFIYQFVSELLISIPDIIAGPISSFMAQDGIWGSKLLGGIVVVILTLITSLLVMGITFALLRVRKVVLQAMDEAFTKLVDKFLETNTAPTPDKTGMLPALAAGAGAGAGMAMGNKLASGIGAKIGGAAKPPTPGGQPTGQNAPTNAGGLNGNHRQLTTGKDGLALEGGSGPGEGPNDGSGVGNGGPQALPPGSGGAVHALPAGGGTEGAAGSRGSDGGDRGGPLQLTSSRPGSSRSDKEAAQNLSSQGGLSNLGYSTGNRPGPNGGGTGQPSHPGQTQFGQTGTTGRGSAGASPRGSEPTGEQTRFGLGAAQAAPGAKHMGQGDGQNGGVPTTSASSEHTSGAGNTSAVGPSSSTQSGTGSQVSASPSIKSQAHGQSAHLAAGTRGPVRRNPDLPGAPATAGTPAIPGNASVQGAPGTRSTQAGQGRQPVSHVGANSPRAQGSDGSATQGTGRDARSGAGGAAALAPSRARIPAQPASSGPSASASQEAAPAQGYHVASSARSARPSQGQPIEPTQSAGARPAPGSQSQRQVDVQHPQAQAPGSAPAQAQAQLEPRTGSRPTQQAQPVQSTSPRPQQGQRREQGDRSATPDAEPRPSARQQSTGSVAPKPSPSTPRPQAPAKPRRAAEPAPKRMDGPVSQKKPTDDSTG